MTGPMTGRGAKVARLRQQSVRLAHEAAGMTRPDDAARATARRDRALACALTADAMESGRANDAARAMAAVRQARAAEAVAAWRRPRLDGDAGAAGAGRGDLEVATIGVLVAGPGCEAAPTTARVVRRRSPRVLAAMPAYLQDAATRFAALIERTGAMRCMAPVSARGGRGISDGGAAARWYDDRLRVRALRAIGRGVALAPRGAWARGREAVTDMAVVEAVVLDGESVDLLLARHGWSRRQEHRDAVSQALRGALERIMQALD